MADDINAVLDRLEAAQEGAEPEPEPQATPEPTRSEAEVALTAPEPPMPGQSDETKIPDNATVESLWKEVKDLRKEAGTYRTERNQARDDLGRYTSAFDGVDDSDRGLFLELVGLYKSDPAEAARWMKQNAEHLLESVPAAAEIEDERNRPLTRAEYEQLREAEQIDQLRVQVLQQVRDLGYDPEATGGKVLMQVALEQHGGDLEAAHQALTAEKEAERAKWIEEYVNGKKGDANAPAPVTGGGAAGAKGPEIKSVKDAGKAVEAWLEATQNAVS